MGDPIHITADADKTFYIVIPGRQVLIAYRPVDTVAVLQVSFEIQVAPSVAGPGPKQAASPHSISSYPVIPLRLLIRVLQVIDIKMLVVLFKGIMPALYRVGP